MKNRYNIFRTLLVMLLATATLLSCSKWDAYKKYSTESEVIYSGKVDSLKAYPGNKRVELTGMLNADPKIATIKIFWNNGTDSVVYDAKSIVVNNMFDQIVSVPEGVANFEVFTYDASGNKSVPSYISQTIYGDVYESALTNRIISVAELIGNDVNITWADVSATAGVIGMQVEYTDQSDVLRDTIINSTSATGFGSVLPNYKAGTKFQYRTLYKPVPIAIDTFYSQYKETGVKYDATSLFFKNAGPYFANTDGTTERWQTPADWTLTPDVLNGDYGRGGLDAGWWLPSPALSLEAWWGMPVIPNGKIYQTFTLPAGRYEFIVTTFDCSDGDDSQKYITIANGTSLPDIGNVPAEAIAYAQVSRWSDISIKFELQSDQQVSIGIQASMPAHGNFMKVGQVRLYGLP